jgi:integrase
MVVPKTVKALSALEVNRLTSPGFHLVGTVAGLGLVVAATGARSWILRTSVGTRRREMGLGPFPQIRLAEAIERAKALKTQIAAGVDPLVAKEAAALKLRAEQTKALTFEQAAKRFMAMRKAEWRNPKHASQWAATLEQYAYPVLGALAIADVDTPHVLRVLEPIWTTKTETASRLRGRIEMVLNWAKAQRLRSGENPAAWRGNLDHILPKPGRVAAKTHFASMPYAEVSAFMERLRGADGMGARALEFAILCAARSGEVRGARWSEFDLATGVWTIPAARMKAGKPHRVPLSTEALALLHHIPRLEEEEADNVFWAPRGGQLSDMTLTAVLRRMGSAVTAHGFRSTFRTWAAERTAFAREVCEAALAHKNPDAVEAAYQRSDLFEKRKHLMQAWSDFCHQAPKVMATDIVPIHRRAA